MPLKHGQHLGGFYLVIAGLIALAGTRPASANFVTFESGQVRPLALSPDGTRLFVAVSKTPTYQKVGMFGMLRSVAFDFRPGPLFGNPGGFTNDAAGDLRRRQVEAFVLAIDSNLKPIIGQQITLTSGNAATVSARLDLLNQQAPGNCDLVVKGTVAGEQRGWFKTNAGFRSDRASEPLTTDAALRALAATVGQDLTYTCVPPGSGERISIDRDSDTYLDADEVDAGTDPADSGNTPCGPPPTILKAKVRVAKNAAPAGDERLSLQGEVSMPGTLDPATHGFRFVIEDDDGTALFSRAVPAPSALWKTNNAATAWTFNDRDGMVFPGPTRVTIRGTRTPGLYKFKMTTRDDDFRVATTAVPLRLFVVLGSGPGQCGRRAFNQAPSVAPLCKVAASGNTVSCR